MPYYFPIRYDFTPEQRARTVENLLRLRAQLHRELPPRTREKTLLLATWNIRDFDSNKFGHGPRLNESLFYIAEIISRFDLVAVQEVNVDLSALHTVMKILGPDWRYIATDKTEGTAGNQERMAYIYDSAKVHFENVAGEVVLSQANLLEGRQFARTPFLVSFLSGWFKFFLCTVHIYFGRGSVGLSQRIAEIDAIAELLAKRAKDESANYILLGDFNIISPEHATAQALHKHGFVIPQSLSQLPSNFKRDHFYDQIAFMERGGQVSFSGQAGVLDFYRSVFRKEDFETYRQFLTKSDSAKYYANTWRTFQMSDHLPMWVELNIDFAEDYLERLRPSPFESMAPHHPLAFSMPQLRQEEPPSP